MTTQRDRIAILAWLATVMSDRALAPVASAKAQVEAAHDHAKAIAQIRAQICVDADDPVQAALMARQAIGLRHRHAAALSDLARLQARLDHAKAAARPAFGRKIMLERLQSSPSRKR